jgi:hypothetical protein
MPSLPTPVTLIVSPGSRQIRVPCNVRTVFNSRCELPKTVLAKDTDRNARLPLRRPKCNFKSCALLLPLILSERTFLTPDTSRSTETGRLTPDTVATSPATWGGKRSGGPLR